MENKPDSEKTIHELAEEAMKAIKASSKRNDKKDEEEAKKKEADLKQEVENKIKKKLRNLLSEEKKDAKKEKIKQAIEDRFMVNWSNPDEKGFRYEGQYNDKYTFRINKGGWLYHLYVEDKDLISESWHHNSHTSIDLYTLKEKADKILKKIIDEDKKNNKKKGI